MMHGRFFAQDRIISLHSRQRPCMAPWKRVFTVVCIRSTVSCSSSKCRSLLALPVAQRECTYEESICLGSTAAALCLRGRGVQQVYSKQGVGLGAHTQCRINHFRGVEETYASLSKSASFAASQGCANMTCHTVKAVRRKTRIFFGPVALNSQQPDLEHHRPVHQNSSALPLATLKNLSAPRYLGPESPKSPLFLNRDIYPPIIYFKEKSLYSCIHMRMHVYIQSL